MANFQKSTASSLEEGPIEPNNANSRLSHLISALTSAADSNLPESKKNRPSFCSKIQALSETQRKLRIDISSDANFESSLKKKQHRNRVLKEIKQQQKKNIESEIESLTEEINNATDSHRMFKAARLVLNPNNRKKPIVIHSKEGYTLDKDFWLTTSQKNLKDRMA